MKITYKGRRKQDSPTGKDGIHYVCYIKIKKGEKVVHSLVPCLRFSSSWVANKHGRCHRLLLVIRRGGWGFGRRNPHDLHFNSIFICLFIRLNPKLNELHGLLLC